MLHHSSERFHLRMGEANATGYLNDAGFVVCEGSTARKGFTESYSESYRTQREQMIAQGILREVGGLLRFTRDHQFGSPSGAGCIVKGSPSNGWVDWKREDGRTLSEVKRVSRSTGATMLSEGKREQIRAKHEEMLGAGRIYSQSQLDRYYRTFAERFAPEVLAGLDGEQLLERMHDHGKPDSLVYWLEFKNDEEFSTKDFGSIAGGSALKFRIFRRKETGNWQAGDERNKPHDIPLEKAVEMARQHRDQLLAGAELISQLPSNASDDEYAELQDQMDELSPDVSRLAWGHKYFSLLFPDKLDDFHSPEWQRFHILKLLQLPPGGDGRYICAGRFVSAASEAGIPMNQLTGVLNAVHGRLHRYWRVGTRGGKDGVSHWQMMQDESVIAIGWRGLGDLSWLEAKRESRAKLKKRFEELDPDKHPTSVGNDCSQLINFVAGIGEGDLVLASDGQTVLGIGRVTGEYRYEPDFGFPQHRPVEWLSLDEWKMPIAEGLRSTVREIRKHAENILEAEKRVQNLEPAVGGPAPRPSANRKVRLSGTCGRIQSVLERKSQVILYGPPGTGKTYWAEKAANDLAAISHFGEVFDDLSPQQKLAVTGDNESAGHVRVCCFHPAYGYEDFLEGYRPHTVGDKMAFELRDGVFKRICNDAESTPDRNFYLIIDEINRGDIPRIFGELLTTLEKDKRGKRIELPVSRMPFIVPKNVFLIGTMNTADRSISLLDAALRRRFGFIEMMPDGIVLKDSKVNGIPLRAWFDALNERIRQHVGRDSRNLQIGHSYLLSSGSPIKEIAALKRALRDDVIPLLEEYCYEDYATLAMILGGELVDAAAQRVRHELFEDGQEDLLVQALLSPCPEISTSTEAISSDESSADEDPEDEGEDEAAEASDE